MYVCNCHCHRCHRHHCCCCCQEELLRTLIQQYTNHPDQDKRGRRRYRDSVHWGAVARVRTIGSITMLLLLLP
jgi:hypothetical protein